MTRATSTSKARLAPKPGPVIKVRKLGKPTFENRQVKSTRSSQKESRSRLSAEAAIDAALDRKALAPVVIDVSELATYTDFIAIVSGRNERQVQAIAEHVEDAMKKRGHTLVGREGRGNGRWTLLDYGDVVIHVFYHPVREVYDIEGLWAEAPRIALRDVPPEAVNFHPDALYAIS